MVCWRCGLQMKEGSIRCPECGAEPPKKRRRSAAPVGDESNEQAAVRNSSEGTGRRRASVPAGAVVSMPGSPAEPVRQSPPGGKGSQPPGRSAPSPASRPADAPPRGGSAQPQKRAPVVKLPQQEQPEKAEAQPRMVRRHEYEAIVPSTMGYDKVNWLRLCLIAVASVILLAISIYVFTTQTDAGQRFLARAGREASAKAFHEIGKDYLTDGSLAKAIESLEIAQGKEPDNLEILVDLGKAYKGGNKMELAELAFSYGIEQWPQYPESYRLLVDIMLEKERNYEALQVLEMALENIDEDEYFQTLYDKLLPKTPSVSRLGSTTITEEIEDLTLEAEKDAIIYYTLDGITDPREAGIVYTEPLYLEEGTRKLRAVAYKDGMFSKEQTQLYVINKLAPDMPRSSIAPGMYKYGTTMTLKPALGSETDTVAIYYTDDGTIPSMENGKLFTDPIKLRYGKNHIQAVAYNADEKASNIFSIELQTEGGAKLKTSMDERDTIGGLTLFSTTRSAFEEKHGKPISEQPDGEDILGSYTRLTYQFGYAVFLDRGSDREPVLVELETKSSAFSGPRGTGIGSRMQDVISAYRDEGGEDNAKGGRLLYSLYTGRIGMITKINEDEYTISYYAKLENGQYIELTYHTMDGLVDSMYWIQYDVRTAN